MTLNEFEISISKLKKFFAEKEKLDNITKILTSNNLSSTEFGSRFIDDYISVIEIALGDKNNSVAWFVFDNDFGKKKLTITVQGIPHKITNEKKLYKILKLINK